MTPSETNNGKCCENCSDYGWSSEDEDEVAMCGKASCPCHTPSETNSRMKTPAEIEKEKLKEHLLANFCDGDSWEDADALSLTKHGALEVAEYFYALGISTLDERMEWVREKIEERIVPVPSSEEWWGVAEWENRAIALANNQTLQDVLNSIIKGSKED